MLLKVEHKALEAVSRILEEAGVRFEVESQVQDIDAEFRLLTSGSRLLIEYKSGVPVRHLDSALAHVRNHVKPKDHVGLCVRRLTWSLLEACKKANVALFDLEGNAYVRLPGLYIERIRTNRESRPESASGTVFTAKASRLARAFLWRYPHDWSQARLVQETGLSAGYVSTLVKRLIAQEYISDRFGLLYVEDPERLLDDWLAHYRFDRHRKLSYAMDASTYEAGVEKLGSALSAAVERFAWTGWTGAQMRAAYATPTIYMAYVSETPEVMSGIFPVEQKGNVSLYVPHDEGVFQFTTEHKSSEIVSDAQLYLDLSRMPGRAREQADALRYQRLDFARMTQ